MTDREMDSKGGHKQREGMKESITSEQQLKANLIIKSKGAIN